MQSLLRTFAIHAALVFLALPGLTPANEAAPHQYNIAAQPLEPALRQFAVASGIDLLFSPELVAGRETSGLKGTYRPDEALTMLLQGTGLKYTVNGTRVVLTAGADSSLRTSSPSLEQETLRIAQAESTAVPITPAQDRQSSESTSLQLEEVLVTATKRTERLADVPMSIAVIGGQDIDRRGLIGAEDYLRSIPGVNQIERSIDNAVVIRGITTSPQAENFNSGTTVATYFGETPITAAAGMGGGGIDLRPVDMERIEVLRGPQGTAYGSSSLSGTIRLLPAKPQLNQFSAKLTANYSESGRSGGDNDMIQGVINLPLVADRFAVRAVGYRYEESGIYRNVAGSDPTTLALAQTYGLSSFVRDYSQDDVGAMVTSGGRLAAFWRATDRLDLSLNVLKQEIRGDGAPEATLPGYTQARFPLPTQDRVRGEQGEVTDINVELANAVLNYDLGWGALTAAASWVDGDSAFARDVTQLLPATTRFPAGDLAVGDFESSTAEVRVASQLAGPLQFLAGVFYEDIDQNYRETIDWQLAPAPSPFYKTNPVSLSDRTRSLVQRALFGELSYAFAPHWTATIGGRYFDYDKGERVLREGGLNNVPTGAGVDQFLHNADDGTTFKANLSYKPMENGLLYASWSQGFRLGRTDTGLPGSCDANNDGIVDGDPTGLTIEATRNIDSDFLDNYEVGGRVSLLDRRLTVDGALFYIDWTGLPIRAVTPGTCGRSYTANVGSATSKGVELQASVVVVPGLRVDFGGSYTHAALAEDAPGIAGQPRAGARLPGSPRWNGNLAAQYDFDLAGHSAFVRVDSFYTGAFYGDLLETPGLRAGDYIKVDARAGLAIHSLTAELFVRNLTNEDDFTWRGIGGNVSGAVLPDFGYRLRPRTAGLQLSYTFE